MSFYVMIASLLLLLYSFYRLYRIYHYRHEEFTLFLYRHEIPMGQEYYWFDFFTYSWISTFAISVVMLIFSSINYFLC